MGGHGMGRGAGQREMAILGPQNPQEARGALCSTRTHSQGADPAAGSGNCPILRRFGGTVGLDGRLQPFVCGRGINYFVLSLPRTEIHFGAA